MSELLKYHYIKSDIKGSGFFFSLGNFGIKFALSTKQSSFPASLAGSSQNLEIKLFSLWLWNCHQEWVSCHHDAAAHSSGPGGKGLCHSCHYGHWFPRSAALIRNAHRRILEDARFLHNSCKDASELETENQGERQDPTSPSHLPVSPGSWGLGPEQHCPLRGAPWDEGHPSEGLPALESLLDLHGPGLRPHSSLQGSVILVLSFVVRSQGRLPWWLRG